jgi:MYXO-CTERM domain-containing protein
MAYLRGRHGASLGATLGVLVATGCSGDAPGLPGAVFRASESRATEPAEARAIVDALRTRLQPAHPAVLAPSPADRIDAGGERIVPHFSDELARGAQSQRAPLAGALARATVVLPARASGVFRLADEKSGVTIEVALAGAGDAVAEVAGGLVVYRGGHASGADVLHRPTLEGTEDFLSFARAPEAPEVGYELALGDQVAGLRLVASTLELLDAGGAPRLRMAPPYIIDAAGERREASVAVGGCAYDSDPRPPWGRAVTAAGASRCEVRVTWRAEGLEYPALLDPAWTATGSLATARESHAAVTLGPGVNSGKVLVVGGNGPLASAELYDPGTGTWGATGGLTTARTLHTATLLGSGLVVVAGGQGAGPVTLASAERYDPAAGTWSATLNAMPAATQSHTASVLPASGKVLVAGGSNGAAAILNASLYDPTLNSWSATGSMVGARVAHTASVLTGGNVLVAGGFGITYTATAELYNPVAGTWSAAAAMTTPRDFHTAVVLLTGKVLVAGGANGPGVMSAEIYDPSTNNWNPVAAMSTPRYFHTASLLASGKVLVAGGTNGPSSLSSTETYDPTANTWTSAGTMVTGRYSHTASAIAGGKILVAAGHSTVTIPNAEVFGLLAAGVACAASEECLSGFCVDGVCCSTACTAPCQACSTGKTGAANGTCANVTVGTDPDNDCTAQPPSSCGTDGMCDGAGACRKYVSGTVCAPTSCGNGTLTAPTCNGSGTCQPNPTSCGLYACANTTMCATTCTNDAGCIPTHHCQLTTSTCVLDSANGQTCNSAADCLSGNCVDGFCCDAPCTGLCQSCAGAKNTGGNGTCSPVKPGTDPDNECTPDATATCQHNGFCDGANACQLYAKGTSCGLSGCNGSIVAGLICDGLGMCVADINGTDCAPYQCHPGGCANPCVTDLDCVLGKFCSAGACVSQAPLGAACTIGNQCQSGFCIEGVCCDSGCTGTCQACKAAAKVSGADGVCGNAKAGVDPHNDCAQDSAASCKFDGFCDGNGACRDYAMGTQCGQTTCVDNAPTAYACNGAGACLADPTATSCGAFLCSNAACTTTCATAADCAPGAWCNAGQCQIQTPKGQACATVAECATGFCADGFCCDTACTGQCEACDATGGEGTCVPVSEAPHGVRPACPTGSAQDPCTAGSCDGVDRTACVGFVGSAVSCRPGNCTGGIEQLPAACDGKGTCPLIIQVSCEPFACDTTTCKTSCTTDDDCAKDIPVGDGGVKSYRCQDNICILGATCDGDHTITLGDGTNVTCEAYKCEGNGTCRTSCGSVDDCTSPNICNQDGKCVSPSTLNLGNLIALAGCAMSSSSSRSTTPGAWLLVLVGVGLGLGRRRRGANPEPATDPPRGLSRWGSLEARWPLAFGILSLAAPSCSTHGGSEDGLRGSPAPSPGAVAGESAAARAVVDALRDRFASRPELLAPTLVDQVDREGDRLRPRVPDSVAKQVVHRVALTLPARARGAFQLTDVDSEVAAEVTLEGASDAPGEIAGGFVVYRGGYPGADIVHRAVADGAEDHLSFAGAPRTPEVRYGVKLGDKVAGLRLVSGTLELLDAGGAPRLRMAPPYVIDAAGERHAANVAVSGCAYDTDPRAPWGRPVTAAGAQSCTVRVAWSGAGVRYPAVVDPAWTATGNMSAVRALHTATVLGSGNVLIAGGRGPGTLATADLYNPVTGTWAATGGLTFARHTHTASLLANGNAVVVGGTGTAAFLSANEQYNPGTGTWSAFVGLTFARSAHVHAVLTNGKILVAGGAAPGVLLSAELYDPALNMWTSAGNMNNGRFGATATALPGSQALVAGGSNGADLLTSERYDATANTWTFTTGLLTTARQKHTATLLSTGKVMVVGGTKVNVDQPSVELYDPTLGTWSLTAPTATARHNHTASVVLGGKVLVAGGLSAGVTQSSAEMYDPAAGTWTGVASMGTPRDTFTASVLASGQVLAAGGFLTNQAQLGSELFAFTTTGAACAQPGDCASGFCVDGVCCNTLCNGLCQACIGTKTGAINGVCANVTANTDPDNDCATDAVSTCQKTGLCNGAGACQLYASGTVCAAPSCVGGVQVNSLCNGSGSCATTTVSCAPYICAQSLCGTDCTGDAQCAGTSYCQISNATCQPDKANGGTCTSPSQCTSGNCIDGFCCNAPCGGLCQSCANVKTGAANGTCAPITAGTDPDNECTATDPLTCGFDGQCNGAGACRKYANGVSCGATACAGNLVTGKVCDGLGTCGLNPGGTDCAPYLCLGTGCANPCGDDSQCTPGNYCDVGTCKPKGANGAACTAVNQCLSNFCTDGICCNTLCNGICQACTAADKASGPDGTCGNAKNGSDLHDDCGDQGAPSCQSDGLCDGSGACRKYAAGTTCKATVCVNNAPVAATCNGAGSCLDDPNPTSCGDYLCSKGACATSCTTDADCDSTAWCNGTVCQARVPPGQPCTVADACTTGICADGFCCNAPCQGQCEACDVTNAEGTCLSVLGKPHGARAACDPGTPDHPCLETSCDGVERSSCAGFVGSSVVCRPASCTKGVAIVQVSCDGQGNCPALTADNSKECPPFACEANACKTACAADTDCALGYRCEDTKCVPGACDGDHTVIGGGKAIDCSPFKCKAGAACETSCKSVDQCAAPNVCDLDGTCVAPPAAPGSGSIEFTSACSYNAATSDTTPGAAWLSTLVLAGLAAARRRRSPPPGPAGSAT